MLESNIYNWTRFWHPRGEREKYVETSYFFIPGLDRVSPNAKTLNELADVQVLILLGERGIGKSFEITKVFNNCEENDEQLKLKRELYDYTTDHYLVKDIFECNEFKNWKQSSQKLFLFLDGLDEGFINVKTITKLLYTEFEKLSNDERKRLYIRITCRTNAWVQRGETFGERLKGLWKNKVFFYELATLSPQDIALAAGLKEVDLDVFLKEVGRLGIYSLITRPVELTAQLLKFKSTGELPKTAAEAYELACEHLCTENQERIERGTALKSQPHERVNAVSQVAATMMFSGSTAIWRSVDLNAKPHSDITEAAVYSSETEKKLSIDSLLIQDSFDTGLFASRAEPYRLGWTEQKYFEFLAAYYVVKVCKMPLEQIMSLITNGTEIVEQLQPVAVWLASMDPNVFREIMRLNPALVLESDMVGTTNHDREMLVEELLSYYTQSEFGRARLRNYEKLCHPKIGEQLQSFIEGKGIADYVRVEAIEMAGACGVLADILLDVVLDSTNAHRVRKTVISTLYHDLRENADFSSLSQLLSSNRSRTDDPDFVGYILACVWPEHLSTTDLFTIFDQIRKTDKEKVSGRFYYLLQDIPNKLTVLDLLVALEWTERQDRLLDEQLNVRDLVINIMRKAWEHIDDPQILDAFARAAWIRLQHYETLIPDSRVYTALYDRDTTFNQELLNSPIKRRKLIAALVPLAAKNEESLALIRFSRTALFSSEDTYWMLDQFFASPIPEIQDAWACLITWQLNPQNLEETAAVYEASQQSDILFKRVRDAFQIIDVNSEEADELRKRHQERKEWEKKLQAEDEETADFPVLERIVSTLEQCELQDSAAWTQLNFTLSLNEKGYYDQIPKADLMDYWAWNELGYDVQERIRIAAKKYLLEQYPYANHNEDAKFKLNMRYATADAGYRAFFLLNKTPGKLQDLSPDIWQRWASIIVSFETTAEPLGEESIEEHQVLVKRAYQYAAEEMRKFLGELINVYNQENRDIYYRLLNRFDQCWDTGIHEVLLSTVIRDDIHPGTLSLILTKLFEQNVSEAYRLSEELLRLPVSTPIVRERVTTVAKTLLNNAANADWWPTLWEVVREDNELARDIFTQVDDDQRLSQNFIIYLSEQDLFDLLTWLYENYPEESDPNPVGFHTITPREQIGRWRDNVTSHLANRGTLESVQILEKFVDKYPQSFRLRNAVYQAKKVWRQLAWQPHSPEHILRLAVNSQRRIITDGNDLLSAIIDALKRLEVELQYSDTPQVGSLWNIIDLPPSKANPSGVYYCRPKDEHALSDFIKVYLDKELKNSGIIVNREVEISRSLGRGGASGERTDIYVTTFLQDSRGRRTEQIVVIIETKGCWHKELFTAMESQLYSYLVDNQKACHGLYLVGWFNCPQWDKDDSRRTGTLHLSDLEDTRQMLAEQAKSLCENNLFLRAYVLDASLRNSK